MREHSKLQNGTPLVTNRGEKGVIQSYSHYKNANHYYDIVNPDTGEIKTFQYSAIKGGTWTWNNRNKYDDVILAPIIRKMYDRIRARISERKAYEVVYFDFVDFADFYNFVSEECEQKNGLREKIINREVEPDKDLLNYLLFGEKSVYNRGTIIFVTKNINRSLIRQLIKQKNTKEMLDLLKMLDLDKYNQIIEIEKKRCA